MNIIITGASGLIATELIHDMLMSETTKYHIFAVTTNIERLAARYADQPQVTCCTIDSLVDVVSGKQIDAVVHCAFARNASGADVAQSIDFARRMAEIAKKAGAKRFVNISSQSVYGKAQPPFWKESNSVDPDYLYAMGKYATEQICKAVFSETCVNYTNIRLASVCENARFMNVFVKNALTDQPIKIQGGGQICSFIDARDVSSALMKVVMSGDDVHLEEAYNLGTGTNISIKEMALLVKECAYELYRKDVKIEIQPADIEMKVGMDNTKFCNTFDWSPKYGYKDMIISLFALNDEKLRRVKMGGGG